MTELLILLIPLAGTSLGAAMVLLFRSEMSAQLEKRLLGFAAGVMIAASVWSLLIPAIEMARQQQVTAWVPAVTGFLAGIGFLLFLDTLIPKLYMEHGNVLPRLPQFSRRAMLLFAVTLHNIPEGMAVGVAYAGAHAGNAGINMMGVLVLSVGIAIQNFPEGAIISMPLRGQGMGRSRAFLCGVLSGVVEPVAGFLTIFFVSKMVIVLPYLLAFAAGAMMFVVIEELIPESQAGEKNNIGTVGAAFGFALMMLLDVALG